MLVISILYSILGALTFVHAHVTIICLISGRNAIHSGWILSLYGCLGSMCGCVCLFARNSLLAVNLYGEPCSTTSVVMMIVRLT